MEALVVLCCFVVFVVNFGLSLSSFDRTIGTTLVVFSFEVVVAVLLSFVVVVAVVAVVSLFVAIAGGALSSSTRTIRPSE